MASEDTELQEEYGRDLRAARAAHMDAEEEQIPESGGASEEQESQIAALNIMTALDVAGDVLGAIPFVGGIVRFITGVGAIIQSFKLHPSVKMKAWIINGIMSLIDIFLSFIGLNIIPTQTIGALLIRKMARAASTETKQAE